MQRRLVLALVACGIGMSQVEAGQVVVTAAGESKKITLPGGQVAVLVGPSSEVTIDSAEQVTLHRGSLLTSVTKISEKAAVAAEAANRPSRFKVRARTVVMGVRGTSFFVRSEKNQPLFLCPCEGEISLSHPASHEAYRLKGVHHDIPKDIDTDQLRTGKLAQALRPTTTKVYGHTDEEIDQLKALIGERPITVPPTTAPAPSPSVIAPGKSETRVHTGLHKDLMLRYGVVSDSGSLSAFPSTKLFALAYRKQMKLFTGQVEIGGIFDPRAGTKNTAFINISNGFEVRTSPVSVFYLPGVTFISSTDRYLTSFYQFSHDLGLTVRDDRNVSFVFAYRHFSNAGIHLPNPGRNFLIFSMALPIERFGI